MTAHQLDLFGAPLKPPKKIKVDDDAPAEIPEPQVIEHNTEPEFTADMREDSNAEKIDTVVLNNAEWLDDEEISIGPAPLDPPETEEIIAATGAEEDLVFADEIVPANEDRTEDLNLTDDAIFTNGESDEHTTIDIIEEISDAIEIDDKATIEAESKTVTRGRRQTQESDSEIEGLNIPPDEQLFKRQYYSMRETSAMFGVNQSLLRFWENEFDILQPKKNKKGDRYFRPVDVKNLVLIYHLLRVRKFTLDGAKDYLQSHKNAGDTFELIRRLEKLKAFLLELKAGL